MKLFEHLFYKKNICQRNFILFSALLVGVGLLIVFYFLLFLFINYYLIVYLIAGVTGLIIETIGTRLNLWEYYSKEKPPPISFFGWGSAMTTVMLFINTFSLV